MRLVKTVCSLISAAGRKIFVVTIGTLAFTSGVSAQVRLPPAGDEATVIRPLSTAAAAVVSRDEDGRPTVRAVRVAGPLQIDGDLTEELYRTSPPISDFVRSLPEEGGAPSERTEAWVAFDDANVYVAARVWDSAPESEWIANEMRRDSPSIEMNDQFGVFFDTFNDRRNSVGFFVNPLGGFSDLQINNEENSNMDWNPIAEIRTGRFDGGWTVEMGIPFRSLRYRSGREQVWGIQMRRSILRNGEWSHLSPLPLSVVRNGAQGAMRVSMYGTLMGIEAPPPRRNLEVKPYAISGLETDATVDPRISNDGYADAGLDVKYGITENLTADFTFNTDFAQVEADEQQVNLTRFSLSFPEKREFFLEGQGIFEFGNGGRGEGQGGGGGPPGSAAISSSGRGRGGRSVNAPTLFYSRTIGLDEGEPVPIVGGGRVTGKIGSFDIGAVGIRADETPAADATNFTVLRLRRDVFARSSVGVLLGDRSESALVEGRSNQAYGVDANFAFLETFQAFGYYARTRTSTLDGNDESYRVRIGNRGDLWSGSVDHVVVGDHFNPEVGFLRRSGFRETNLFGRFSPRPESISWIRQANFQAALGYIESERQRFVESRSRGGRIEVEFENSDWFTFIYTDSYERLSENTNISGATIPAGLYDFRDVEVSYLFGPHRRAAGTLSVRYGGFFGGNVTAVGLSRGRIEVLPQLSVEPSIELNWVDFPDRDGFPGGRFDQHVARTRLVYSLSPRMYLSGLVQYNSGRDTFAGNFRFRWEWAPGSELFIVYSEDRSTDAPDAWSELSTRGLAIKMNRLLRF